MFKVRGYADEFPLVLLTIVKQFANCYLRDIIARLYAGATRWVLLLTNAQGVDDHNSRDNKRNNCNRND